MGLFEEDGYRHYLLNSMIGNRSHRKKKIRKILYTTPETYHDKYPNREAYFLKNNDIFSGMVSQIQNSLLCYFNSPLFAFPMH